MGGAPGLDRRSRRWSLVWYCLGPLFQAFCLYFHMRVLPVTSIQSYSIFLRRGCGVIMHLDGTGSGKAT
jgi:hypothetical protein